MNPPIPENLPHLLAVLILVARLGDIGTTYLLTPDLKLEANPMVRRFRWPYALATLLICLAPYVSVPGAIIVLVASLLVSMSNSLRIWLVRTVGEKEYHRFVVQTAGQAKPRQSIALLFLPGFFISLLAITILMFYPDPSNDWGFWIAMGVFTYALILFIYMPASFIRFRKQAQSNNTPR
jgi:RsiW-degrading membrane proteinase PrsW (M82 family)